MTSEPRILAGRYRLLSQIGSGGMGSVWLAEDQLLDRAVALKELVQQIGHADLDERRARAVQEARAMARVRHPAIVRIHDVFFADRDPWIVMDYIRGRSLADIIRHRPLDERTVARISLPVLQGLSAAHRASVLHRDVKPANIVVADDGPIFLVDFGIAKIAGEMNTTGPRPLLGTPEFLAPERLSAGPVGPPADLWSLGVTIFCALEGYSPFLRQGDRPAEATAMAILRDPPPRLATPGRLAAMVPRLLEKDPKRRATADVLAGVLQAVLDEPGPAAARVDPPTPPLAAEISTPTARLPSGGKSARHSQPAGTSRAAGGTREYERPRSAQVPRPGGDFPLPQVREVIRTRGTQAGATMLLTLPGEQAAKVLAGCPADLAGELITAIGATRPDAAASILQMLSSGRAGNALHYLSPRTAASILAAMPMREVVRILGRTDPRTAGGVIMELPGDISANFIRAIPGKVAVDMLEYVNPATVAALLDGSGGLDEKLLHQFSPSFRALVVRHLPPDRQIPRLRT